MSSTLCEDIKHDGRNKKSFKELSGQQFDYWTVLEYAGYSKDRHYWWVQCQCGNKRRVEAYKLLRSLTKSCGCYKAERLATQNREVKRIHGHCLKEASALRVKRSGTYTTWNNLRRASVQKSGVEPSWFGQGGFATFLKDMGERPQGATLRRISEQGRWEKSNCQWVHIGAPIQLELLGA